MYYYIVDPQHIAQREFERIQHELYSSLSEYHISGEIVRVTGVRTINQLVENAFTREVKTLVAVGTDETLHDVINAAGSREVVIGFIPLVETEIGKILGIKNVTQAVKALAVRRIEVLDLGQVGAGPPATHGEALRAGNYFLGKLKLDLNPDLPAEIKFVVDDEYQGSLTTTNGFITRGYPADGVLDFVLLPPLSRWQNFWYRNQIRSGNFEKIPQASLLHITKLEITSPIGLSLKLGQRVLAKTPTIIEVLPQALKMIVGKERNF